MNSHILKEANSPTILGHTLQTNDHQSLFEDGSTKSPLLRDYRKYELQQKVKRSDKHDRAGLA